MKPVFTNKFHVSHNKTQSEVTISFDHVYTDHSAVVKDGVLTDASAQVVDEVASVLVTRDGTIALAKPLHKVVSAWGVDITE